MLASNKISALTLRKFLRLCGYFNGEYFIDYAESELHNYIVTASFSDKRQLSRVGISKR